MKPLYSDSYMTPSDVKSKEANHCPVDTPYNLPAPGPKSAYSAPKMYNTEYQNVGSGKTITVWEDNIKTYKTDVTQALTVNYQCLL